VHAGTDAPRGKRGANRVAVIDVGGEDVVHAFALWGVLGHFSLRSGEQLSIHLRELATLGGPLIEMLSLTRSTAA
jgi:hypothetical protein